MLYLGSLLLGLFSWFLPVIAFFWKHLGGTVQRRYLCGTLSLTACSVAIYFEVRAAAILAVREDASALYDTLPTAAKLSLILLVGTILVNGLLLCKRQQMQ